MHLELGESKTLQSSFLKLRFIVLEIDPDLFFYVYEKKVREKL